MLPADAVYSKNTGWGEDEMIIVKNHTSVYITVHLLEASNYSEPSILAKGQKQAWPRTRNQLVLVTLSTCSGAPRAYLGRTGHTLHIYSDKHISEPRTASSVNAGSGGILEEKKLLEASLNEKGHI